MVLDGPMTGEAFLADVEQVLIPTAPTRRHRRDGQLARPQDRRVRAAIAGAGAQLFLLPPYSPDTNPIE
jgi:transposase